MSQICVRYLLIDDLENNKVQTERNCLSFLKYSAEHWPDHVRKISLQSREEMVNLLHRLYDTATSRFAFWYPIFWKALMPFEVIPKMDAIHLAAFNGHTHIMRLIHENRDNVHKRDSGGSTALMWASLNGHYEAMKLLLEQGANFNAQGRDYDTALHAASSVGYDNIVQMLLKQGANVNAQGRNNDTALHAAALRGHDKIAQMLLE